MYNVNPHFQKGDIYGFIGRNGAGKTTTMRVILGTLLPMSGEVGWSIIISIVVIAGIALLV